MDQRNENLANRSTRWCNEKVDVAKKELLIRFVECDGLTLKEAASNLGIKYSNARKITASIDEVPVRKGAPKKLSINTLAQIERISSETFCFTLNNIKDILHERQNISLSIGTIAAGLEQIKISLKEASYLHERVNAPQTLRLREQYADHFLNEAPKDLKKCIFIDESGFNYHVDKQDHVPLYTSLLQEGEYNRSLLLRMKIASFNQR